MLGAENGIQGVLNDRLIDMRQGGSGRAEADEAHAFLGAGLLPLQAQGRLCGHTDYKRILEIFKKYDVRYFFYNGGNDSMDTCNKISKYMLEKATSAA